LTIWEIDILSSRIKGVIGKDIKIGGTKIEYFVNKSIVTGEIQRNYKLVADKKY